MKGTVTNHVKKSAPSAGLRLSEKKKTKIPRTKKESMRSNK